MTVINNIHYDINPLFCCPSVFSLTIYDSLNPRRPHDSSKNFNIFWIFNQEIVYKVIGIYDFYFIWMFELLCAERCTCRVCFSALALNQSLLALGLGFCDITTSSEANPGPVCNLRNVMFKPPVHKHYPSCVQQLNFWNREGEDAFLSILTSQVNFFFWKKTILDTNYYSQIIYMS